MVEITPLYVTYVCVAKPETDFVRLMWLQWIGSRNILISELTIQLVPVPVQAGIETFIFKKKLPVPVIYQFRFIFQTFNCEKSLKTDKNHKIINNFTCNLGLKFGFLSSQFFNN